MVIALYLSSFISAEDIGGLPFDYVIIVFSVSDGKNSPGTARATYDGWDLRPYTVPSICLCLEFA